MPDPMSDALDVLCRHIPTVSAVYVFGSAASGSDTPASDLDLALLADCPLGAAERFDAQERIAAALGRDVDLVDLRSASTVMQARVVSTGRVVLDADPAKRARFETVAYSAYALLNEERAGILDDIAARGTVYG